MTTATLTPTELQLLVDKRAQELREMEIEDLALAQIERERTEAQAKEERRQAEEQRWQRDKMRADNLAALTNAVDAYEERVTEWRQKADEAVAVMEEIITEQTEIYHQMDLLGSELANFLIIHQGDLPIGQLAAIRNSLQKRLVEVDINFVTPTGSTTSLPVHRARAYVTSKLPPPLRSALMRA